MCAARPRRHAHDVGHRHRAGGPSEERDRVFTLLPGPGSADPESGGVGLGLAITATSSNRTEAKSGSLASSARHAGVRVHPGLAAEYSEGNLPKRPTDFEALLNHRVDLQEGELLEYARNLQRL